MSSFVKGVAVDLFTFTHVLPQFVRFVDHFAATTDVLSWSTKQWLSIETYSWHVSDRCDHAICCKRVDLDVFLVMLLAVVVHFVLSSLGGWCGIVVTCVV